MFLACQVSETRSGINGCRWRCKSNQCCVEFWNVVVLWDFVRAKSNLSVAFAKKRLSTRSEQQASLWCTCIPVASSPNEGVSLLARWLKAKKARTSGCVRQENEMHLTTEICGLPAIQGHAWTVTSHGIGAHEEKGEPAELMEAYGTVAPTPFSHCQACERQLNQLWERKFFAGAFVAIQQRAAITTANQLDSTLFLNQNMAHLLTWTTHASPSSMQEVIEDGQMSWKLNLHRPTCQICQTLPVPGTQLLSVDPPTPLSLSLAPSVSLSLSLSLFLGSKWLPY